MSSPVRLWLFDIDGTLVDSGGAGMAALREAARVVFGGDAPELDLAGSTDSGVVAGILAHFGSAATSDDYSAFYSVYLERLEWNLMQGEFEGRILPGVVEVLEELGGSGDATIGLLTGNIAAGAGIKMRHFGLDRHFGFGAYGCDHCDRNRLGPLALERAAAFANRAFSGSETLIIGDTPKDIACARAMGARCLAVATGSFSEGDLQAAGADLVVGQLTREAVRWFREGADWVANS